VTLAAMSAREEHAAASEASLGERRRRCVELRSTRAKRAVETKIRPSADH
jgi:hypothetical protein